MESLEREHGPFMVVMIQKIIDIMFMTHLQILIYIPILLVIV